MLKFIAIMIVILCMAGLVYTEKKCVEMGFSEVECSR